MVLAIVLVIHRVAVWLVILTEWERLPLLELGHLAHPSCFVAPKSASPSYQPYTCSPLERGFCEFVLDMQIESSCALSSVKGFQEDPVRLSLGEKYSKLFLL